MSPARSVLHNAEGKVIMAEGTLILHAGGKLVTLDDLTQCKTPPPEGRWHPVPHVSVLTAVKETLHGAGYVITSEKLALARSDARFFGILNLETPLASG